MKKLLLVVVATLLTFNWLAAEVGNPKDGMALSFDGSNDYLRVEAAPEIRALNELTVETWVYLRSYSTYQTFITGECDLEYYSWTLREGDGADGKVEFVVCGTDKSYKYAITESGSIPLDKWTHVAGVFDNATSTITVYINGENAGSQSFTGPIYPSNEGMYLGRYPNENNAYLKGSLENTAVWNKARTQNEIKETMHSKLEGNEDGLLAYYDYDFEDGTIVEDKAGSFNATLNSMDDEDWVRSGVTILESPLGTGTSDDPYQIASLENLMWLSETPTAWNKYISQTADIDAKQTEALNEGKGFSPIGGNVLPFSGVYMGNGHTIDSLYINRPEQDYIGFFGITKASSTTTISNLGLTAVDITGHDHTGGFLGTGETNSTNRAIISECFVTGKVDGHDIIGGFVGHAKSTQISNSYSIVEVRATGDYSGGFTGSTWCGLISNCYSTGEINGTTNVGGFTAFDVNANHCFWNTEISGINTSTCGTPLTNDEMQNPLTFINNEWDFISESHNGTDNIWGINETDNNGYPFLAWQDFENTNQDLERPTISAISDQFITYSSDDESAEMIDFTSLVRDNTTDNTTTKENLIITQSIAAGTMINSSTDITVTAQDEAGNVSDLMTFSIILKPSDLTGEGTEASPYEIANLCHLKWLSKTSTAWNKHISQTADINASQTKALNDGKGFSPIGNKTIPFSGVYNGNGHIIDSLYINRPAQNDISFFGISKASSTTKITKLGLTNVNITGHDVIGGFLGTGETNSTNRAVISECFVTGKISGHYAVGGFTGGALAMQISNCYSIVKVNATGTYCGGFTGTSWYGLINNCYCTGEIIATTNVGGFTPYDYNATNCFWNKEISGINTSTCGTPLTNDEMTMPCTFYEAGWDFMAESNNGTDNVWGINNTDNNGYPFLAWQNFNNSTQDFERPTISAISDQTITYSSDNETIETKDYSSLVKENTTDNLTVKENLMVTQSIAAGTTLSGSTDITVTAKDEAGNVSNSITFSINMKPSDLIGEGTEANPYEIANLDHLKWLSNNDWVWIGKYFIQSNDINAKDTESWNAGKGFACIGTTEENPNGDCFEGSYDGQGHSIDSLYINRPSESVVGLFASCKNSTIKKLGLTNASVTGGKYAGILKGVDYNDLQSSVDQCFTTGVVAGTYSVGGLIGHNGRSSLSNSYSTAQVNAVTATYSGGLCGVNYVSSNINNCYSTGLVNSTSTNSFGFSGENGCAATINHCFWDIESSNKTTSAGGIGKTTAEMTMPYTFHQANWDLMGETNNGSNDIWGINPEINAGYPFLTWQGFTSVTDYVRPEVSAIANQEVLQNANSSNGTLPDYTSLVNATDNVTALNKLEISQQPAAGTVICGENNTVTITVKDEAANYSTSTFTVKVVNKAPVFNEISSTLSIEENSSAGTTLLTVSATDENGDDLYFSSNATEIIIDETTGVVSILDASYFEKGKHPNISFEVKVSDGTLEDIETVTITISVATSDARPWSNQDLVLYPNPAKDNVTLKLPKYENEVGIELVTINGIVVLKQNVLNEQTLLNTSNLCPGIYIMLITTDNTTIQKQLLIE